MFKNYDGDVWSDTLAQGKFLKIMMEMCGLIYTLAQGKCLKIMMEVCGLIL